MLTVRILHRFLRPVWSLYAVRNCIDGVRLHIMQLKSAVDILVNLAHDADIVPPDNVEP